MNTAEKFGRVIANHREKMHLSRSLLWEKHLSDDMSKEYLYLIESGKRTPTVTKARAIARALGTSLDQLLDETYQAESTRRRIPLVSWDEAGNFQVETGKDVSNLIGLIDVERDTNLQALRISGIAMEPRIPDGSLIILAEKDHKNDDFVVAQTQDNRKLVRQFKMNEGRGLLMPVDPMFPMIPDCENAQILGVVISVIQLF